MTETKQIASQILAAARDRMAARGRIEVPEWRVAGADGKKVPAVVFFRPMSMAEQFEITGWRKDEGAHYGMVRMVVLKTEDADGTRLFSLDDEPKVLREYDAQGVLRIAHAIMASPSIEDAEKN